MSSVTNLWGSRGTPLDNQLFSWRDMVSQPISKLDDDAFTRIRVILLNGTARVLLENFIKPPVY